MTTNSEWVKVRKATVVPYIKVIAQHSRGDVLEIYEEYQPRQQVPTS
jgi:hypothetical protein